MIKKKIKALIEKVVKIIGEYIYQMLYNEVNLV